MKLSKPDALISGMTYKCTLSHLKSARMVGIEDEVALYMIKCFPIVTGGASSNTDMPK